MVAYMADEREGQQPLPHARRPPGKPTHGHLRENRNHGGKKTNLPDARKLKDGAVNPGSVDILGFNYRLGDLRLPGQGGLPPVITPGQIADLREPGQPAADLPLDHLVQGALQQVHGHRLSDRGRARAVRVRHARHRPADHHGRLEQLHHAEEPEAGTYTYFCRIHPFMRGAFRVKK